MSGFAFTRDGLVPLADSGAFQADEPAEQPQKTSPAPSRSARATARPSGPIDVVKLAKARLREIEKDIQRLTSLVKERDELRRLLDAASNKPRAVVRDINAAKRG